MEAGWAWERRVWAADAAVVVVLGGGAVEAVVVAGGRILGVGFGWLWGSMVREKEKG